MKNLIMLYALALSLTACSSKTEELVVYGIPGNDGVTGPQGPAGQDGKDGVNGINGVSCSIVQVEKGTEITCGDTSLVVTNGLDGINGQDGQDGATGPMGTQGPQGTPGVSGQPASGIYISEIINPCGAEFSTDEVLLRLSTGQILALFDGGPQEDRLTLLAPGNYVTTDRNKNHTCNFTVTSALQITNERVD